MLNIEHASMPVINVTKIEPTTHDIHREVVKEYLPLICVLSVIGFVGIIGNICTIAFYCKSRPSSTSTLIVSLAWMDLFVCLTSFGMVVDMSLNVLLSDPVACKVIYFLMTWTLYSSTITLWAISVDRFRKICHPLKNQLSIKGARNLALVIVVLAAMLSCRVLITQKLSEIKIQINSTGAVTGHMCNEPAQEELSTLILVFHGAEAFCALAVCTTLIITYSKIIRALISHFKDVEAIERRECHYQNQSSQMPFGTGTSNITSETDADRIELKDIDRNTNEGNAEIIPRSFESVNLRRADKNVSDYKTPETDDNSNWKVKTMKEVNEIDKIDGNLSKKSTKEHAMELTENDNTTKNDNTEKLRADSLEMLKGNKAEKYYDNTGQENYNGKEGKVNMKRVYGNEEIYWELSAKTIQGNDTTKCHVDSVQSPVELVTIAKHDSNDFKIKTINASMSTNVDNITDILTSQTSNIKKSERKATVMMLTTSVGFLMCFVPYMVIKFTQKKWDINTVDDLRAETWIPVLLPILNSVINPPLYCALNRRYRLFIKDVCIKPCMVVLKVALKRDCS